MLSISLRRWLESRTRHDFFTPRRPFAGRNRRPPRRAATVASAISVDRLEDRTLLATTPLDLQPIDDQTMSHSDDTLVVNLSTTADDPSLLTFTADLFALDPLAVSAYDLDQQYGLFDYTDGHYWFDYFGLQEKWMEGFGRQYYYITPDGGLYFYDGSISTSPLLATLDASYHADPTLLHEALPPSPIPADATGTINGDSLIIDPADGFVGQFMVTVEVTDGTDTDSETFSVSVENTAPTINAIADQTIPGNSDPFNILLSANDPDGDPITFSVVEADPLAALAYQLDQQHGLFDYTGGHYWFDFFGLQEKWMEGFEQDYYYITPDGSLFFYNGSIATSPRIATLDASYHAVPSKLHDAVEPAMATGDVDATISGNVLTVSPAADFYGQSIISIVASDGYDSVTESFTLNVLRTIDGTVPVSLQPLTPLAIDTETGEKPQSKTWRYADTWWAVLSDNSGTHVWRLDGTGWTRVLELSSQSSVKADVKVVDDVAHLLLEDGGQTKLRSIEYAAGSYQFWSVQPNAVSIPGISGAETATIDIDSTGRMWIAYDLNGSILVRYSDAPYNSWSSAITLVTGVTTDDISDITALPDGTIGVMWSNQNTDRFGFRVHVDGTAANQWLADEVPASQSALNVGTGMADDHISLAVHPDGTLYAAVKTSYDTSGFAKIALLIRRPNGTWDDLYSIDEVGTRPIVQLNEQTGAVFVIYRVSGSSGSIVYREVIDTGAQVTVGEKVELFEDGGIVNISNLNDVTGSKANVSDEMVVLARTGSHLASVKLLFLLGGRPLSIGDNYTVAEGGTLVANDAAGTVGGTANDGVLVNDSDDEALPLTANLVNGPSFGSLTLDADGTFIYIHDGSENYFDQFQYRANNGNENGNIASVNIAVTPVNDLPVSLNESYTIQRGRTLTADDATGQVGDAGDDGVLVNDTDAEGDPLSAILVSPPLNGTVALNADGTFVYTHDGSFTTSDRFEYRANDGSGDGNLATASITILPVNDPPTASDDFYSVGEAGTLVTTDPDGTSGSSANDGVLANDSDPEGNPLAAFLVRGPSQGTLELAANGTFSYTHNGSENLSDSFTYRPNDGTQDGNTATAHITINPVNDAPVSLDDEYAVTPGGTLVAGDALGTAGGPDDDGVLANDSDAEGSSLSAALVVGPSHGTLDLNSDGTFVYTHDGSDNPSDSFTYRAFDGSGFGNVANVDIAVGEIPVDPVTVSFQDGVDGYSGTSDATIAANTPTTTLGVDNELEVDGSPDEATLLMWDLSGIAPGSTVLSVSMTFNVTNRSDDFFEIYNMTRAWVEQQVTWQESAAGAAWENPGASGSGDHGSEVLGVLTAPVTGSKTLSLNAAGLAQVQQWLDDPFSNHGFIIQDYTRSARNGLVATSREGTTAGNRPMITITYVPSGGSPVNRGPHVDAGPDQSVFVTDTAALDGTVSDDGLPNSPAAVTTTWSAITGPGVVTFADASSVDTTASFSQPGTYMLRLTADDGDLNSSDDVTVNVADASATLTVSFQDGIDGYSGTTDAPVYAAAPTSNFGGSTELEVDGSPDKATLVRWDVSTVSAGSSVVSASITVDVTNRSDDFFEIYGVLQGWSESQVTWTQAADGSSWQTAGAIGAGDHGSAVLGTITAPSTGLVTLDLNAAGMALVQSWMDDPSANFGLIFQDYDNGSSNGLDFSSRESAVAALRPKLTVTYTQSGASPLLASPSRSPLPETAFELTPDALALVAQEASRRWLEAVEPDERDETSQLLDAVRFEIADLPGSRLGESRRGTIGIDPGAAGYGWFVDVTPHDDFEFSGTGNPVELYALPASPAAGRMDLLSALLHELGHVLGHSHSDVQNVMHSTLSPGTRRSVDVNADQHDAVTSQLDVKAADDLFSNTSEWSQLLA